MIEEKIVDIRLWDSQWVSVVNHAHCYEGWDVRDAVDHAVKMTEEAMASNMVKGFPPKRSP